MKTLKLKGTKIPFKSLSYLSNLQFLESLDIKDIFFPSGYISYFLPLRNLKELKLYSIKFGKKKNKEKYLSKKKGFLLKITFFIFDLF